jgi:acyl carrier protein
MSSTPLVVTLGGATDLLISRPMNIEETLKAHIGKELISGEKTDLDLDTDLIGLVDSTGVMELTVWIESTFGFSVEIDDITAENFGTIRRLADWIRRNSTQPAE